MVLVIGIHLIDMRKELIFICLLFLAASAPVVYREIVTDVTMTGLGSVDSPLKVDSSKIATVYDLVETRTYKNVISPAQITSDQDNYNPSGWDAATVIRLDGDNGIRAITSMTAPTSSVVPQSKILINIGSYPIYIPSEHPDGTAANRITYKQDLVLYPKESITLTYDGTSSMWRPNGLNPSYLSPTLYYSWLAGSATAGDYGDVASAVTGTAAAWGGVASSTTLPANAQLTTGSTNAGAATLYFAKTSNTYTAYGTSHQFAEYVFYIPTLSNGTETYTIQVGLVASSSTTTLAANNTVAVRYTHGTNSGKFQGFSKDNAGAESTADLGTTVATNTIYRVRIELDKARAEARFYVNGTFAARITGNMPNNVANGMKAEILKSAGTTARTLNIISMNAGAIYP